MDYELAEGFDISSLPERQYDLKTGGTHPVGGKGPNAWGLYDMLGNVWEWCSDRYRNDKQASGAAVSASAVRVVRGGSWDGNVRDVRAAYRLAIDPGDRGGNLGFRCGEFRAGI